MGEFLHEYAHIMSDPAHLLAEITLMLIIDVLFLGLIWPLLRTVMTRAVDKRVAAEHAVLDAEHGVLHSPTGEVYRAPAQHTVPTPAFDAAPPRAAFPPDDDPGGYR